MKRSATCSPRLAKDFATGRAFCFRNEKTMSSLLSCPKCGRPLPASMPEGLCAKCLFTSLLEAPSPDERAPVVSASARRFAGYELLEVIARGGMGVVWKARHTQLNRIVALKLISVGDAGTPDFVERFQTEAEAAASLDHPNIVPVYEFGESEGQRFLAMKFVEGGTLAGKVGSGGSERSARSLNADSLITDYSPLQAAALLATIAHAVHYAHQRGVLHRDIKPGNILLDAAGQPHLTDFGLAKLIEKDTTVTKTLAVLGTPSFMSPEQAAGRTRDITTAADVYGLGAVLYDLLTGEPPFAGGTTLDTIRQVMEREPKRPSLLNPAVDRDLETICLKCLEKESGRRYGSAEALADDLERWERHEPILARPAGALELIAKWVRRHRTRAALLATVLLAILGVAVVSTVMSVRVSSARRLIAEQAEERRRELVQLNVATGNRLAEEGDPFAALKSFAEAAHFDAQEPERLAMHRLRFALTLAHLPQLERIWPHTGAVTRAGFSSDGRRVVTAAGRTALVWDAISGEAMTPPLAQAEALAWAGFSPDDRFVATRTGSGSAQVWSAETGAPVAGPFPVTRLGYWRNALAPALAFSAEDNSLLLPGNRSAVLRSLVNDTTEALTVECPQRVNHAFFSPDGSEFAIAVEGGAHICAAASGEIVRRLQVERPCRNGAWSADGSTLALADDLFRVHLLDAQTGVPVGPPLRHDDMVLGCQFSPDSARLLTWSYDNTARLWNARDGRPLAAPLRHQGPVRAATFSPQGQRIATASADGAARLWDAATGESLGRVLRHGRPVLDVAFAPDGERMLTASADGQARLWRISTNGHARWTWPHGSPTESAVFSPDGAQVAVVGLREEARVWEVSSGTKTGPSLAHPKRALDVAWLDYARVITTCADGQVRVWEITSGKVLSAMPLPQEVGDSLQGRLLPDGHRFVTCWAKRPPVVWDVESGQPLHQLGEQAWLNFGFSRDGGYLVTVRVGAAQVWATKTGAKVGPELKVASSVAEAAVSEDGRRVATTAGDFSATVWDVSTGRRLAGPLRHVAAIRHLAFTPDGRVLATASDDRTLRLWDADAGEALGLPLAHGSRVLRISVRADGRAFATACSDGQARVWEIPPNTDSPGQMRATAARLVGGESPKTTVPGSK